MDSNVYVEAQMLIRKPVEDVFEAFINPEVTTHFWFTKSTGRLEEGKTITWEWEMYGVKRSESSSDNSEPTYQNRMGNPSVNVDYEFKTMENGTLLSLKAMDSARQVKIC
jgi:hypothetical protein